MMSSTATMMDDASPADTTAPSILLVDDDGVVLDLLTRFFTGRGWIVERAATGGKALERYAEARPDLVLLDLDLPDLNGIAVLQRLRARDGDVTAIMLTGHGDVGTAVEAMRVGAEDFLTKPVELDHIAAVVDRAMDRVRLRRSNRALGPEGDGPGEKPGGLGRSPEMREIADRVDRLAAGDATVLLGGETGTGKGWVARRIHDRSGRADKPFVEINCGGLSPRFLESELFGHEEGAFTDARSRKRGLFEVADGGTLFLDEIGDLTPELQPKLLKVLESQRFRRLGSTREIEVDVRLIAATNRDLSALVKTGRFREDLYYRLAVLPLSLPPLRERGAQDIAALAYNLLDQLRSRIGAGPARISDAALHHIVTYSWPGNIRELRNLLERILILADDAPAIEPGHLPPEIRTDAAAASRPGREQPLTLEEVERRHIATVLEHTDGNRSEAARLLGIARATLYEKLDRYDLREVGL